MNHSAFGHSAASLGYIVAGTLGAIFLGVLGGGGCRSSGPAGHASDASTVDGQDAGAPASRDAGNLPCGTEARLKGESCTCSKQCETGFCADGICCDSACGGTCLSCRLPTSLGTCTPIPPGQPPRAPEDCPADAKASCGRDGTCDGAGQCRNHVEGTVCKPGACEGDAIVGTFTCDGARGCKQAATTVCAPFSCDHTTNECFSRCASDGDCVSGRKCVAGSCGPKMNGSVCVRDNECASEHCADGTCCNTACDGECRACNLAGRLGVCQPFAQGQRHTLCAEQAATACGTTGTCDGFGSCATYPASTICGSATCAGVTAMNTARVCNGLGACRPAELLSCGTYRCASGRCNSRCVTSADCADGVACVNSNCGPKLDGQPCTANQDCLNLNCVKDSAAGSGICCNTACAGACRSCSIPGSLGRCSSVAAGAPDPRLMCTDMTAATCGTDGKCNGAGECRLYPAGTVCAGEACAADLYTAVSTCSGAGACTKPAATSCSPYHCNADRCFNACTSNAQCVAPNTCGMNGLISSCGLKPLGAKCSAAAECSSNFCVEGVCCNNSCGGACQSCANATGTCGAVAVGTADPLCGPAAPPCGRTGLCAAGGTCAVTATGTSCGDGDACNGTEVCQGGACIITAGSAVVCHALDQCHLAGTCTNGVCSNPESPNTTACGAGPMCSAGSLKAQDRCSVGGCVPGAATPCPSGACADTATCAASLPECTLFQSCAGTPPPCVCANGTSCGSLLPFCS